MGAVAAVLAGQLVSELSGLLAVTALVSGGGGLALIGYALNRDRVVTVWTPSESFDFEGAGSTSARRLSHVVRHYS
jgi:hypothetical protein